MGDTSSDPSNPKVTVVGDGNTGKTSMMVRFVENRFPEEHEHTQWVTFGQIVRFLSTECQIFRLILMWMSDADSRTSGKMLTLKPIFPDQSYESQNSLKNGSISIIFQKKKEILKCNDYQLVLT